MNVTSKNGSRTIKLTARERRLLESAYALCEEIGDLSKGMVGDRAAKACSAISSMLARLDGRHGGEATLLDACGTMPPGGDDSVTAIRKMRDGEWADHPANTPDGSDPGMGESHVVEEPPPACEVCGSSLSPREARAGKFCRQHAPSTEAVA